LVIFPARMQDVQTWTRRTEPFTTARTRWMFGLNRRRDRDFTRRTMAFLPRRETEFPNPGCFPQTSQTAANVTPRRSRHASVTARALWRDRTAYQPSPERNDPSVTTLFSAAAPYLRAAVAQLREAFPGAAVAAVEPELGAVEGGGPDVAAIAGACVAGEVTFVRHLAAEVAVVEGVDPGEVAEAVGRAVADRGLRRVALQAWGVGGPDPAARVGLGPEDMRAAAERALAAAGVETRRSGAEVTVALCLTSAGTRVCVTPAALSLSDWPGGRIRLARRAGQVSRAEFKLEELFSLLPVPAGDGRRALDLGASPGGWTRVLRSHGYEVWSVDTGALHPSLLADPGVHVATTTAARFLAEHERRPPFDVVVNDMRMVPSLSCDLMVAAAPHVAPGGMVVVTLKVSQRAALREVRAALGALGRAYEVVFARQLFHNRNEVTVVGRR
jgi:23S rRNA (cytidine2498-2'-O)-methyltransferase